MRKVMSKWIVGFACSMVLSSVALADLYKYRDLRGHIHLTDRPMPGMTLIKRYSLSGGRSGKARDSLAAMRERRSRLAGMIERAAEASSLPPELIHAVVRAESAYKSDAVSSKGAVGLMQLMPGTAERYGVTDRQDPMQNLDGGTRYLRDLLRMFDNDLELALAGYNAGENAVIRYGNAIPPFPETQNYVRKVIRFYRADIDGDRLALR